MEKVIFENPTIEIIEIGNDQILCTSMDSSKPGDTEFESPF